MVLGIFTVNMAVSSFFLVPSVSNLALPQKPLRSGFLSLIESGIYSVNTPFLVTISYLENF